MKNKGRNKIIVKKQQISDCVSDNDRNTGDNNMILGNISSNFLGDMGNGILSDDGEDSRSIIAKHKSKLCNMYPNWDNYNVRYNFYNFKKFNKSLTIPIQYKTPTIFLDGLYFELPRTHIIGIKKQSNKSRFNILVAISKQDNNKLVQIFKNLDEYNMDFFDKNNGKFNVHCRYTKKNNNIFPYASIYTKIPVIHKNNGHHIARCNTPELSEEEYPEPEKGPIKLDKNPMANKMEYKKFYTEDDTNIYMNMEIKQQYMQQILEGVLKQIDIENAFVIYTMLKNIVDKIKSEHFSFKMSTIDLNLKDSLNLEVLLWIKCSLFTGNEESSEIAMKWKICNYEL